MWAQGVLKGLGVNLRVSVFWDSCKQLVSTSSGNWRSLDRAKLRGQTAELQNPSLKKRFCKKPNGSLGRMYRNLQSKRSQIRAWKVILAEISGVFCLTSKVVNS